MTRVDKMLYEARLLDVRTREHRPFALIEMTDTGKWKISGYRQQFDSEKQAVKFCQDQAGRPMVIVICDIPRTATVESADVQIAIDPFDPLAVSEAIEELTDHAKGAT